MTDLNPYQNQPQAPVQYEPAKKPTSVTVFGILNCVFGGIGLVCAPIGILGVVSANKTMQATAAYNVWMIVGGIIGIGFSIWLLALGIGLLMMRKWARVGSVIYACVMIMWNFIGVLMNIAALYLGWLNMPEVEEAGFIGGTVGGFCGGLIYPILLLIFMQTAKVKQAFQSGAPAVADQGHI